MNDKLSIQLRRAIRDSGLSGYAICKGAGINKAAFSRFMHGERGLTLGSASAICDFLKLELVPKANKGKAKGARK